MVEAQIYNIKQKTVYQKINKSHFMISFIIVENQTKLIILFRVACKCNVMKFKVYITRQSGWLLSKSLQAINAGEGVEKREPSYTVGGNAN